MASPYDEKLRSLGDGTMTNTAPTGYPQPAYAPAGAPARGPQQILRPTSAVDSPIAPEDSLRLAQIGGGGMGVDTGPISPGAPTNLNSLVQNLFGGNGFSGKAPAPSLPQASYSNEGYSRPPLASPTAPAVPAAIEPTVAGPAVADQGAIDQDLRAAAHSRSMGDRSLELAKQGVFGPTPGLGIIDGAGAAGAARQSFFDDANLRSAAAKGSWSPRKGYQGDEGAVRAAMVPIQNRQRLSEISLKNVNDQSLAALQDSTQRRGQDVAASSVAMRDATDRRGQDVTLRGQDVNARTAAGIARADQMNKDRQFGLDVQKFGQETAKSNYEQRRGAEESYDKELAATFRTKDGKGNDVPDTAKAASFKQAANTTIASMIEGYKRSNDPKHQKMATDLESKGFAALDKKDKEELQQLFERRQRMQESGGMGGTRGFRQSDNLMDYRQRAGADGVEKTLVGGDRLRTVGGGNVSVNDLRYTEPANTILPDWLKTPTNDLTRGLRGF